MEKCYYAYCRPKLPNHPWSLERIPFGKSILTTSKDAELKSKKCIPFDVKVTDDIGITLNQDGTFSLPIGKYMIDKAELKNRGGFTFMNVRFTESDIDELSSIINRLKSNSHVA